MPVDVRAEEIDGVPVFHAPVPGPARAALVFRVGRADETLPTAGITHTVEHLAMFALGRTPYGANAFVDSLRTVFYATGEPDQVVGFLRSVMDALGDLPVDRLEQERQVLMTEAARRGGGTVASMLTYRYGARTYGLPAYDEHGLRRIDEAAVRAWAQERFTWQNAAVWTTVPLPADLQFELPDGTRRPPPEPHTVDPLPARMPTDGAVGLDCVAERSIALGAAWSVLQGRAFDTLRREHAVVYDVSAAGPPVGAGSRQLSLLTDPLPDQRYRAGRLLVETVEQLLRDGPTKAELRDHVATARLSRQDPDAAVMHADTRAFDTLLGHDWMPVDQQESELASLTPGPVTQALRDAVGTAMWALPDEVFTSLPLRPTARWSARQLSGRAHRRSASAATDVRGSGSHVLRVGEQGVTRAFDGFNAVTVAYDTCAAMLAWRDGTREVHGDDGFRLLVRPWEWEDGDAAVRQLDAGVPADRVVDMGEGSGPPEGTSQPTSEWIPPTGGPPKRTGLAIALAAWAFVSLIFATFAFSPTDPGADAGPLSPIGCDRDSSLDVFRDGPGPDVLSGGNAPAFLRLAEACRDSAREDVAFSVAGGVSLLACAGVALTVVVRGRRRASS